MLGRASFVLRCLISVCFLIEGFKILPLELLNYGFHEFQQGNSFPISTVVCISESTNPVLWSKCPNFGLG